MCMCVGMCVRACVVGRSVEEAWKRMLSLSTFPCVDVDNFTKSRAKVFSEVS